MLVSPRMTKESQGWPDTGPTPEPTVTPEARWLPKSELESGAAGTQS